MARTSGPKTSASTMAWSKARGWRTTTVVAAASSEGARAPDAAPDISGPRGKGVASREAILLSSSVRSGVRNEEVGETERGRSTGSVGEAGKGTSVGEGGRGISADDR